DAGEQIVENEDGSLELLPTVSDISTNDSINSALRENLTAGADGTIAYTGSGETKGLTVSFADNGEATVGGGMLDLLSDELRTQFEQEVGKLAGEAAASGLRFRDLSFGVPSGKNIFEWLNAVGDEKTAENEAAGEDAKTTLYQRTQVFSTAQAYENTLEQFGKYASGVNHAHLDYDGNSVADFFSISDFEYDDGGELTGGTYRVSAVLTADTNGTPAAYSATVTVVLGPAFKGWAGLPASESETPAAASVKRRDPSEVDASALYPTYDGHFQDDPSYEQSGTIETLSGDMANSTGTASSLIGTTSGISNSMKGFGTGLGFVSIGASMYNFHKTFKNGEYRIGTRVWMRMDLQALMSSTCYKRLTQSKKQLVDEAFQKYKKAEKNEENWDGWATGIALGCDVASIIASGFGSLPGGEEFAVAGMGVSGLSVLNGATLGKAAAKARQKTIRQYEESYRTIKNIFLSHAMQTGLDDCKHLKKDDSNSKTYNVNHDPSGVVYEGVIENPVKDAVVTLWYAVDADGLPVTEANAGSVSSVIPAAEVEKTPMETVQVTGADGKYAWFVPQGLWFVTAEKAGLKGDSDADLAAVVGIGGATVNGREITNLLPVLPEQLDVNIPLVDRTAPVVESVRFTEDGVYVTFSKYMEEDLVLDPAVYTLSTAAGPRAVSSVTSVEQGHTPSNIDGEATKTYTRTVLIASDDMPGVGAELLLTVSGSVKSYAGTDMGESFADSGVVEAQTALSAPVIEGGAEQTVAYGDGVKISLPEGAPEGAGIRYTTDGSDPTGDSKLYERPFAVTNNMTVKAVAVCPGYPDSAVVSARYTVAESESYMPAGTVVIDSGASPEGLKLTLTGEGFEATAEVASDGSFAFHDVPTGSYTLAFAGSDEYEAASAAVEVTTFDPWAVLYIADKAAGALRKGDVDGDGSVTAADARLALRAAVSLETLTPAQTAAANVDGDGSVTPADARLILRSVVGLEELPGEAA
ncbi:MAG: chitobiase/beta-hexosaminidase C-terminal domain-containing protein, partial [Clostridia bacterium]|nr:chitobiase/beta-hexosaminidase C-terminal domain-containing protein [Clostridia bacterium]